VASDTTHLAFQLPYDRLAKVVPLLLDNGRYFSALERLTWLFRQCRQRSIRMRGTGGYTYP
jgi:hypothetical protein